MTPPTSRPWSRLSIRSKWTLSASVLIAMISLAAFLHFPGSIREHAGIALLEKGQSIANVTAFAASVGLVFADPVSTQEALEGAIRVDGVAYVVVKQSDGAVLAAHNLSVATAAAYDEFDPLSLECPWCRANDRAAPDVLPIEVEVLQGNEAVGHLYLGLSRAALRAEVAGERLRVGLLCLAALLFGVFGAWAISSVVTGPLNRISSVVEHVAAGDLTHRAPIVSEDEVGRLARAFNAMIDQVSQAQVDLRDVNESLEERVDERTRELTDAMQRHDRAEASNRRLAAVVEQSAEILIVTDVSGYVEYVNPAFERTRGVSASEIVGVNLFEKVEREFGTDFIHDALNDLRTQGVWTGNIEQPRADGSRYTQRTTVSTVMAENGDVTGFVAAGEDVTRELELESRLRDSQKMEAVGQLAGGIAHDFNNLLTAIRGHSELLLLDAVDEDLKHGLDQIGMAADRATALTRQLLAFGRRQILRPEPMVLADAVANIIPTLEGLTTKATVLRTAFGAPDSRVVVDASQLERMLMDLVLNSRDAIDDGGRITISIHRVPRNAAPAEWSYNGARSVVRLSVEDNGRGISPEYVAQVFEPFFTTKDIGEGVGLGLASVAGVMKQSGGAIAIDSEAGGGTRVDLFFEEAAYELHEEDRAPGYTAGGRLPILVADDEALVRSLVRRYLELDGHEVIEAADGEEAWKLLVERSGEVSMVLSDVRMPGIDGLTLARRVSVEYPGLRVLLMSGFSAEIADEGGSEFELVSKPFGRDELLSAVGRLSD